MVPVRETPASGMVKAWRCLRDAVGLDRQLR